LDINPILERDFEVFSEELELLDKDNDINLDSIIKFFKLPMIENIVRQLYASSYQNASGNWGRLDTIQKEFNLLFSTYFNVEDNNVYELISLLFGILIEACDETLKDIINNNPEVAAHSAQCLAMGA